MFLNIREEDIRADCPHNAPMTLRAFNKISPRQFNTTASPLNPFEIPRYAPTTVGQFSKALLQQQSSVSNQISSSLSIPVIQEAILAETLVEDFIVDIGFDAPTVEQQAELYVENLVEAEEKGDELITQLPEVPIMMRRQSRDPPPPPPPPITADDYPGRRAPLSIGPLQPLPKPQLRGSRMSDQERLLSLEKEKRIDYGEKVARLPPEL